MRKIVRFLGGSAAALVLVYLVAASALSHVAFERKGRTLLQFALNSGKGKLVCLRREWSNTELVTKKGMTIRVVDPFMYCSRGELAGGKTTGGYWSKPEVWDTWKVQQIKSKYQRNTDIVWISAAPEGYGLKKEVTISVEKNQNIAYVFNRITATQGITLVQDRQAIYFRNTASFKTYVDGKEIAPKNDLSVPVQGWVMFHHPAQDVSTGLIFMDRRVQKYPLSHKRPFATVRFRLTDEANGTEVNWSKGTGRMGAGTFRTQQYILMWGDGDLRERVEALSKQALAGQLNRKVYLLPEPAPTRRGGPEDDN